MVIGVVASVLRVVRYQHSCSEAENLVKFWQETHNQLMTCNALVVVVVVVVVALVVIVEVLARMLRVVRYQHLCSTAENPVEFGQDIRILLVTCNALVGVKEAVAFVAIGVEA